MLSLPESGAATLAMLMRCHAHQWPEDHGRAPVSPPSYGTEIAATQARGPERLPETVNQEVLSTWCAACGVDHGDGSPLVGRGVEA